MNHVTGILSQMESGDLAANGSVNRTNAILKRNRTMMGMAVWMACVINGAAAMSAAGAGDGRLPDGYEYFIGIVGNPSSPDTRWSDDQLTQLKSLGVNMVQLSIAWGGKPANEVLNLEDLDAEQREQWTFRIKQAEKHGLKTIAHFGVPRMLNYSPVIPACIMDHAVREKYVELFTEFLTSFPEVDDIMIYTYDQQAWICSEFGPCPRCSGLPLHERLPEFINLLKETMQEVRPGAMLWWKPWELSTGQMVAIFDNLDADSLGLVLNPSTSNEVYPFNDRSFKADLGVKRLVQMAHERKIPVIGEFNHTLYKPLYLIEDYFPRLVYEQMRGWREMEGIVGIKEYYGFSPAEMSVNAAMLQAWIQSPDAALAQLLEEVAAPYGERSAPLMIRAWEYVAQSVEAFPWDVTYMIGQMGLDRHRRDGAHEWEPVSIMGAAWQTPIWQANRRGNFMLTQEHKAHPWLFEDAGLRLEDSAALAFRAVELFDEALGLNESRVDEVRKQRDSVADMARAVRAKSLHFLLTLAAQNARMVQHDERQFALVTQRLEKLLLEDLENQRDPSVVRQKLAELREDPQKWLQFNFKPLDFATTCTMDWNSWTTPQR
jgi:hypothetical protein